MSFKFSEVFQPKLFELFKKGNYNKQTFTADVIAGVIVGIIALPLAIAFGIASGVSPQQGLITAVVAGFLVSFFGGSHFLIGGPTGAFIVIVYGIVAQYGISGLIIATVLAGVMLVLMGIFKLGSIIKFMPYPIIVGFTGGIAITIFSTQMNDLLGLGISAVPANFVDKWICYFEKFSNIDWWSAAMGIASIAIIALTPKFSKKVPGSLLAIIVMTVIAWLLKEFAGISSIKTIGDLYELPSGLPSFTLPSLEGDMSLFATIQNLAPVAFTIAMLGAIESLLSAMVADGIIGDKHNSNTELIGQGIANMVVPFFGGIPATGAIARTMANINNGGKTPVAGIVHTFVLLLVLLFLGGIVGRIPMPCLAGVLVMVSYNMSGWRTIVSMCRKSVAGVSVLFVTLLLTVFFDLTLAIEAGLIFAIVIFMKRITESTSISVIRDVMDLHHDGENGEETIAIPEGVEVYEIEGPFFFGIANKFDELTRMTPPVPIRILRMRKVAFIDSTALHNLEIFIQSSHLEGREVILSGVHSKVDETLTKAGVRKMVGEQNICPNIHLALERAKELLKQMNAE